MIEAMHEGGGSSAGPAPRVTEGDGSSAGRGRHPTSPRGNPRAGIDPTPRPLSTVRIVAAITLRRLGRGKALWIGAAFAALPAIYAAVVRGFRIRVGPSDLFDFEVLLLAVLPAMFIAASVGEDLEDRTSAYLWSRPIARWALLAGKLCALAPIVAALLVGSLCVAFEAGLHTMPSATSCLALAAGCVATSLISAGIATVVPRHAMALSIGYLLVDQFIGALPFTASWLSITWYQTRAMAGLSGGEPVFAAPAIAMVAIAGIWTAIGVLRIRRLEV